MCADKRRATTLPEFTRWLAGSKRPRPASHKHLGPVDPDEAVTFTLVLRRKQGTSLPDLSPRQAAMPEIRAYLSAEEYARVYGAEPAELEAAAAIVRWRGMTVLESHAGRRTLSVLATAAHVKAVFGVELQCYEDPWAPEPPRSGAKESMRIGAAPVRSHRGFDGPVYLPPGLAEVVVAVVGLDNRFLGILRGGATSASHPSVPSIARQYEFPNVGASSETIGILAAQAPGFPGTPPCYLQSDINDLYFASLSAEYQIRPASIVDINLTIGTTTYTNNPAQVTNITSLAKANSAILELTQDISTSATIAQGATIHVYFTEASEQGYLAFMNRVLLPEGEKQPTVLGFSLGMYETIGGKRDAAHERFPAQDGASSPGYLIDELFRQIAMLGISICVAVGDCGADNWRVLAAPNLMRLETAPPFYARLQGQATALSRIQAPSFFADSHRDAAGISEFVDTVDASLDRPGIPDLYGNVAYSGFFVNGIPYSYMGMSCVASFYAGTMAMLRSAREAGLGFLNAMLSELARNKSKSRPYGDNDSRGVSSNTPIVEVELKDPMPGAPNFTAVTNTTRENRECKQRRSGITPRSYIVSYGLQQ
jgi:kumamolisin